MKRDNIRFTKNILHNFYLKYYWFFTKELPKKIGQRSCTTVAKTDSFCIDVVIGETIKIPPEENFADYVISKIYKFNEQINGDPRELNSIISETMENYSLTSQLLTGTKPAIIKRLNISDAYFSINMEELREDQKVRSRGDLICVDAANHKEISSIQESLDNNFTSTTTIYNPEKKSLRKIVRVYDKKASTDISNKEIAVGFDKADLIREIEVTRNDNIVQLHDYEVSSDNEKNKNCVGIYELETDRSMNEVAAIYVKQLELEKMVEDKIDFKQFKKKIPTNK